MTKKAGAHLAKLLSDIDTRPPGAIRIVPGRSRLTIQADVPREGDTCLQHDGRTVLLLDRTMLELVGERILDVHVTPRGERLTMVNPGGTSGDQPGARA